MVFGWNNIKVERDSVCFADDMDAPHAKVLALDASTSVSGVMSSLKYMNYLPRIRGGYATWVVRGTCPIGIIAQNEPSTRLLVDGNRPISEFLTDRKMYIEYHAQASPEEVLKELEMEKNWSLRWLSHNAWMLQLGNTYILVDPFLTGNPKAPVAAAEVEADYILVSHGHADHLGDTVEIAKRTGATVVAVAEIAGWLSQKGVKNTIAMNIGGGVNLPFGRVEMTPAIHSSTLPDGASGGVPCGFLVTPATGETLYFACDTALFSEMAFLAKKNVLLAMLPVGDVFTMSPADSLEAVRMIRPKAVIPCHYDTWPIIAQELSAWRTGVAEAGAVPVILAPGQEITREVLAIA